MKFLSRRFDQIHQTIFRERIKRLWLLTSIVDKAQQCCECYLLYRVTGLRSCKAFVSVSSYIIVGWKFCGAVGIYHNVFLWCCWKIHCVSCPCSILAHLCCCESMLPYLSLCHFLLWHNITYFVILVQDRFGKLQICLRDICIVS